MSHFSGKVKLLIVSAGLCSLTCVAETSPYVRLPSGAIAAPDGSVYRHAEILSDTEAVFGGDRLGTAAEQSAPVGYPVASTGPYVVNGGVYSPMPPMMSTITYTPFGAAPVQPGRITYPYLDPGSSTAHLAPGTRYASSIANEPGSRIIFEIDAAGRSQVVKILGAGTWH